MHTNASCPSARAHEVSAGLHRTSWGPVSCMREILWWLLLCLRTRMLGGSATPTVGTLSFCQLTIFKSATSIYLTMFWRSDRMARRILMGLVLIPDGRDA